MNRKELQDLVARWHTKGLEVLISKGNDYANEESVLQDFGHLHQLCKTLDIQPDKRPGDTARFMMAMKLVRDANLIGKTAQNESRADTLLDLQNYLYLYRAILEVKECES